MTTRLSLLYPTYAAYRCEQHGHLWINRDRRDRVVLETPLGTFKLQGQAGDAFRLEGEGMWLIYDCAVCESIEAVQSR